MSMDGKFWRGISKRLFDERIWNARGLTLIELAAVVAILGILTAIACPSIDQYRTTVELRQTALQLASDLRFIHQQALIEPDGGWKISINGQNSNWDISRYVGHNRAIYRRYQLPMDIYYVNGDKFDISFTALGTSGLSRDIDFTDKRGNTYGVSLIGATGRISVAKR